MKKSFFTDSVSTILQLVVALQLFKYDFNSHTLDEPRTLQSYTWAFVKK